MHLLEDELQVEATPQHLGMLAHISRIVRERGERRNEIPIRVIITESSDEAYSCEVGSIALDALGELPAPDSIFRFAPTPDRQCRAIQRRSSRAHWHWLGDWRARW